MANRSRYAEFTDELWEPYLKALQETGAYISAADAVGCNPAEIRKVRQDNPAFDALCDIELERHREGFVAAARRRAIDGVRRPIIGGRNRDKVVAEEVVYSDSLMSMFLKRYYPDFNPAHKVEHSGQVDFKKEFDFGKLSKRARLKLRELLEILREDEELARQPKLEGKVADPGD